MDRSLALAHTAINVGLAANAVLAVLKVGFGIFGHSDALLADGVNSTSDVAYFVVVKVFMHLAAKPADAQHPYGHRQLESVAALTVGSFVVTTAIALFWNAVNSVYDLFTTGGHKPLSFATFWVAVGTVVLKAVLLLFTGRLAARTGNVAIFALARDHRNDMVTAMGAAAGILVAYAGSPWADPLVAAGVAILVLFTGIRILREASSELMDTLPSPALDLQIRRLLQDVPGVVAVEEVNAHRFGPYLVLNITVGLDGSLSLDEGHRIATRVEEEVSQRVALVKRVYVHCHPVSAAERPSKGDSPVQRGGSCA